MKKQEKNKSLFSSLKKVFAYMQKYKFLVLLSLVLAGLGAVLTIVGPNQIGKITDYLQAGLGGEINMPAIAQIAIILVVIYLLSSIFSFVQHYIMATITLKTSKKMRQELSQKVNKVPQEYFNRTTQGDILSRITNDVSTLQQGLSNALPTMVSAGAQFVGCLIMMFVTQWRLALCVIAVTILGFLVLIAVVKNSQKYFIARQKSLGALNGYVEEMYSGHSIVKISRAGEQTKQDFDKHNKAVYDANWKSQFLSGVMHPIMNVIGNLGYVAVCVVGAVLAINGIINFGVIISFIFYVRLFTSPLTQLAQSMTNLQTAGASANRIFEFLNEKELSDESDKPALTQKPTGAVSFKNVRFAYPDAPDKIIIKDFSAQVLPGQKVAIVGPTGAGKTTMVNLLMRFYELSGGSIEIDGVAIENIRRDDVHNIFGMVLQDTWLFEGTVRENLVYNLQNISQEQLDKVCHVCGIKRFIDSLPNGYDTVLMDGTAISAGQKQLLTIARAMLQDSPMLILDEATSSIDTRTEIIIQNAMDELTKGRTSFVIAHRLSTIKNADLILVMKDGDIIEQGTHQNLLNKNGFYAELYNSQFSNQN